MMKNKHHSIAEVDPKSSSVKCVRLVGMPLLTATHTLNAVYNVSRAVQYC